MRSVDEQSKGTSYNFMLEEYRVLRERYRSAKDDATARLNFYTGLTSALVGGSLVLGSNTGLSAVMFKLLLLAELSILTVVGLDVFYSVVIRNQVVDKAERGMSRIRRYFLNNDPGLAEYLTYRINDEPTFWVTKQGGAGTRRATQLLVSFILGLAIGIIVDLMGVLLYTAILTGIVASACAFGVLEYSARRALKHALREAQSEIRFGKQSKVSNKKKLTR